MSEVGWRLVGGALAAVAVSAIARRRRSLSADGAVAATVVGTTIVAGGGWWWGMLLVVFFVTSSALSRGRHADGAATFAARGSERDAVQVLANGGVAGALAATAPFATESRDLLFAAFAGAVAAATADTWSTELGRRSRRPPRLITNGRPVVPGTSGGVTPLGTAAAAAGASLISVAAAAGVAAGWAPGEAGALVVAVAAGGFAGALGDSLLGATIQAAYHCPTCDRPTEQRLHRCGSPTILVAGHPTVTNDVVNAAATLTGAAVGFVIARLLG